MKPLRKKAISKSPVFPLPSFCLPLEKLERRTGSFVDETLRERHADLLFWVPRGEGEVLVYVLFEHQSREDPLMGFRLLNYMTRIWAEELRMDPGRRSLPPVLPLVLHQSERRWKASREFRSLIELPSGEGGEAMDEFIPDFRYHLVDLADLPMEALRGTVLVRSILMTMKVVSSGKLLDRLEELEKLFAAALEETDLGLIRLCLEYLLRGTEELDSKDFRGKIETLRIPEIKETAMTIADQLIEEGVQKGELLILERLMIRRFGPLPDWARERLEAASTEELEIWCERILDAPTLDAVFG